MMKTDTAWRVALIVEQALLRNLLAQAIARIGAPFELVAVAADAREAREACLRLRPRLILLDLELAQADALELARLLSRQHLGTRILALSGPTDPVSLNRLDEIGVPGFVDKDQPLAVLEEAMRAVASGKKYRTALLTTNQGRLRSDPHAFSKFLTGREQDILRLVVKGSTSRTIAHQLGLSQRSVETFRYRLMRKLEVRNIAGLMDFAFRHGLVPRSRT